MKKMKTSLIVLTMVASLMFGTIGMAEARSQNSNNNHHQYSHHNHNAKIYKNNCNPYNRYNNAQYGKLQRAKSLKQARRRYNRNGNLYSGFDKGARGWTVVVGCD